jgi:hypothetical protein
MINMAFQPTYVNGKTIYVEYLKDMVRIVNGPILQDMVTQGHAKTIASVIKTNYKVRRGESLGIATNSLAIEIVGHVYPDKILKALDKLPLPSSFESTVKSLLKRTSIIDAGESHVDSNRWVWDKCDSYGVDNFI